MKKFLIHLRNKFIKKTMNKIQQILMKNKKNKIKEEYKRKKIKRLKNNEIKIIIYNIIYLYYI